MKKIIIIILLAAGSKVAGQQEFVNPDLEQTRKEARFKWLTDSLKVNNPKEYYRVMSRKEGINGLIYLGVGAVLGGIVVLHERNLRNPWFNEFFDAKGDGSGYLLCGILSVLCIGNSFVCIYKCARYGGKAATLSIREQQVLVPRNNGFFIKSTPELCLKINF